MSCPFSKHILQKYVFYSYNNSKNYPKSIRSPLLTIQPVKPHRQEKIKPQTQTQTQKPLQSLLMRVNHRALFELVRKQQQYALNTIQKRYFCSSSNTLKNNEKRLEDDSGGFNLLFNSKIQHRMKRVIVRNTTVLFVLIITGKYCGK
eukprot:Pgem_evm1s3407